MVGATGFEPATPCSRSKCATKLRHAPTGDMNKYTLNASNSQVPTGIETLTPLGGKTKIKGDQLLL